MLDDAALFVVEMDVVKKLFGLTEGVIGRKLLPFQISIWLVENFMCGCDFGECGVS